MRMLIFWQEPPEGQTDMNCCFQFYRLPMVLWEGNVSSRACLAVSTSVHRGPTRDLCPWCLGYRHIGTLSLCTGPQPPSPVDMDLFNLDSTIQGPHSPTCSNLFTMKHRLLESGGWHSTETILSEIWTTGTESNLTMFTSYEYEEEYGLFLYNATWMRHESWTITFPKELVKCLFCCKCPGMAAALYRNGSQISFCQ